MCFKLTRHFFAASNLYIVYDRRMGFWEASIEIH